MKGNAVQCLCNKYYITLKKKKNVFVETSTLVVFLLTALSGTFCDCTLWCCRLGLHYIFSDFFFKLNDMCRSYSLHHKQQSQQ